MQTNPATTDLTALFPAAATVRVGDEEVQIRPVTLGQLPELISAMRGMELSADLDPISLLLEEPEAASVLLAICIGRPASWIESLPVSAAARVMTAVLEANRDFFTQAGPELLGAMCSLRGGSAGRTS